MIKSVFEKWEEIEKKAQILGSVITEYFISNKINNKIYFGISANNKKTVYIEFEDESIKNYNVPKIFGMIIKIEKNENIDNSKTYLTINCEDSLNEVFLAFISTLVDGVMESNSNTETIEVLENTIKYYKEFFSNPEKSLSEYEEQGLCGELIYLKKIILNNGPNNVLNWLGPEKNKRDFVFDNKAVEVKTTLNQVETSIKISNENQLDSSNLEELKLVVYVLEKNQNGNVDVVSCANEVLDLLKDVQYSKVFKSKLLQMKIDLNEYKSKYFFTNQEEKVYLIDNDFPCLKKSNIPPVVFNVNYRINLNSLAKYLVKEV